MGFGTSDGKYYDNPLDFEVEQYKSSITPEPSPVLSDEQPDPLEAGQQYASARREVIPQMEGLTAEIDKLAGGGGAGSGRGVTLEKSVESTGYRTRKFNFMKDGTKVGDIKLTTKGEGGKDLYVDYVQAYNRRLDGGESGPNSLGPTVMRSILKQIKEQYPEAERLYGFRVSGARGQAGTTDNAYLALKPGVKARPEHEKRTVNVTEAEMAGTPRGWGTAEGGTRPTVPAEEAYRPGTGGRSFSFDNPPRRRVEMSAEEEQGFQDAFRRYRETPAEQSSNRALDIVHRVLGTSNEARTAQSINNFSNIMRNNMEELFRTNEPYRRGLIERGETLRARFPNLYPEGVPDPSEEYMPRRSRIFKK